MNIDQQLRTAIEKSGLTRYAIAKGAGVEYGVLRRYLDEERDLRLSNVVKLAAFMGLELKPVKKPAGTQKERR